MQSKGSDANGSGGNVKGNRQTKVSDYRQRSLGQLLARSVCPLPLPPQQGAAEAWGPEMRPTVNTACETDESRCRTAGLSA